MELWGSFAGIGGKDSQFTTSSIHIENQSNITISTFLALPKRQGFSYPDTLLPHEEVAMQIAMPGKRNYYNYSFELKTVLEELPSDTLSVYYFSTDTLDKYSWAEIVTGNKFLRRDDLPITSATEANFWLITFE